MIQLDEANLPGHPEEWPWAASAINRVLDAVETTPAVHLSFGDYGGQVVQQGTWAEADRLSGRAARRPRGDGMRPPAGGRARAFKELRPEIGLGLGVVADGTATDEISGQATR